MTELKIDPDLIQKATAQAIVTLLGDDAPKLVEGLVMNAMSADTGRYYSGKREDYFSQALREILQRHIKDVVNQWLVDNDAAVRATIVERIETEKEAVLAAATDTIFRKLLGT